MFADTAEFVGQVNTAADLEARADPTTPVPTIAFDESLWLELGGNVVMVSRAAFGLKSPRQLGGTGTKVNVYVDDVDRHYEHAKAEGATIERHLESMPWGDRRYEAFDLEGHWWHFAQRLA